MNEKNLELLEQFMQMQWLLSRYFHQHHRGYGPLGTSYSGQGRVLKLLKMKPEIAQKELAEILGMRPQSLGELLSKLEKKGYITRTPSENDKRVIIVRLTEEGIGAGDSEPEKSDPCNIFSCLSEEEQVKLSEYLTRITAELETLSSEDGPCHRHQPHDFPEFAHGFARQPRGFDRRSRLFDGHTQDFDGHTRGFGGCPQGFDGRPQGFDSRPQGFDGRPQGFDGRPQGFRGPLQDNRECCNESDGQVQGGPSIPDEPERS